MAFTPLGVFVSRRLPGHPLGRLMVLAGLAAALNALAVSWSALLVAAWLSQWTWWVPWALVTIVLLLFPDGQLPSPRWRPLLAVLVGAAVLISEFFLRSWWWGGFRGRRGGDSGGGGAEAIVFAIGLVLLGAGVALVIGGA